MASPLLNPGFDFPFTLTDFNMKRNSFRTIDSFEIDELDRHFLSRVHHIDIINRFKVGTVGFGSLHGIAFKLVKVCGIQTTIIPA
jgi:hypothetical protein